MSVGQPVTAPFATTFRGPGIRMMFLGFFGTWWTITGCQGLYGASIPVVTAAAIVGLSIFFVGLYLSSTSVQRPQEEQPEALQWGRTRTFRNVNIVQWAAIAALIVTLNVIGHGEWLFPGIMSIVGLHFLPLARLFPASKTNNFITGLVLVAVALIYPFVAAGGPQSPWGPLVAGLILWASALITFANAVRSGNTQA
jgi:hypothetical protein